MTFEEFCNSEEFKTLARKAYEACSTKEAWEPKGGDFWINVNGAVCRGVSNTRCRNFGVERQTKELAEKARDKMRVFNRLLAYVDEACGGYEFKEGEDNYYIFYDSVNGNYGVLREDDNPDIGKVYMPLEVVEELYEKLNNGEVVL